MEIALFFLFWVVAALLAIGIAFARTSGDQDEAPAEGRPHFSRISRLIFALAAVAALVAVPFVVVSSADDRVPSGAGTYTKASSEQLREGRLIFRQTCASCHTLEAAKAHGVYGPNLDTLGAVDAARVETAIKTGAGSGNLMPAGLVSGEQAKLVSEYVAEVAGAGRN